MLDLLCFAMSIGVGFSALRDPLHEEADVFYNCPWHAKLLHGHGKEAPGIAGGRHLPHDFSVVLFVHSLYRCISADNDPFSLLGVAALGGILGVAVDGTGHPLQVDRNLGYDKRSWPCECPDGQRGEYAVIQRSWYFMAHFKDYGAVSKNPEDITTDATYLPSPPPHIPRRSHFGWA